MSTLQFGMQVVMTAAPEKGEELAVLMLEASKLVSKLKGCQLYIVQLSTSVKDTVLITEVWGSAEEHQASLSVPEIRELIGKARPLIIDMEHHTAKFIGGFGINE
jgi:quinol monooxygenase YgiN